MVYRVWRPTDRRQASELIGYGQDGRQQRTKVPFPLYGGPVTAFLRTGRGVFKASAHGAGNLLAGGPGRRLGWRESLDVAGRRNCRHLWARLQLAPAPPESGHVAPIYGLDDHRPGDGDADRGTGRFRRKLASPGPLFAAGAGSFQLRHPHSGRTLRRAGAKRHCSVLRQPAGLRAQLRHLPAGICGPSDGFSGHGNLAGRGRKGPGFPGKGWHSLRILVGHRCGCAAAGDSSVLSNYLKMARRHCRRNHRSAHASCNTPR